MPKTISTTAPAGTALQPDSRAAYRGKTLVGRNRALETDSFETKLNNNVLVIGPSGSGKTRHVLKPNLLEASSSFIVLDTKGTLCSEMGCALARLGYIVMFGRRAEALGRYLAKGRKVAVEGSLRYSTWTSDGAKRSKLEVVIDDLELMSSSRSEGQATRQPSTHGTSSFGKAPAEGEPYTDIPFDSADSSESYPYDEPDSNELCDVDY